MDRKVTWIVLAYAAVVCACGAAYEPGGGEPASGIYALTIEGDADGCAPARATGVMGKVAVLAHGEQIDVMVPSVLGTTGTTSRVVLGEAAGSHASTDVPVPDCEGAMLHREWTMLGASSAAIEVAYSESWTGIAACGTGVAPTMPSADCRAEQRLHYAHRATCVAPCELVWAPTTGALTCEC